MTEEHFAHYRRLNPAPVADPIFAGLLAEHFEETAHEEGPREHAFPDTMIRHSLAGACARAIAYSAAREPETNPMDLAGFWRTGLGQRLHELFEELLVARWPTAEVEVKVRDHDSDLSGGHLDFEVDTRDTDLPDLGLLVGEVKTTGGFGYKKMVGGDPRNAMPDGPKASYIAQGAVNAALRGADTLAIVVFNVEAISVQAAKSLGMPELMRVAAEWRYPAEQFLPIADDELARWEWIANAVKAGRLADVPRIVHDPEHSEPIEITDPATGACILAVSGGKRRPYWGCAYCRFQARCTEDMAKGA
jgi:hypothetical protein